MNNNLTQRTSKELLKILSVYQYNYSKDIPDIKEELTRRGVSQNDIEFACEKYTERSNNSDATTWQRFFNFIVDIFIIRYALGYYILFPFMKSSFPTQFNDNSYLMLLGLLSFLAYYLILEGLFQVTVGKLVTRTKVVTLKGEKPSLILILTRTLCRCIPLDPLSYFGSPGWHDTFSKTRLIKM